MRRHPLTPLAPLAAAFAVALAGCGGDGNGSGAGDTGAQAGGRNQAAVLVTRNCGQQVVVKKTEVPAGQTAMQALDRVADVETASGGKFVSAVNGIEQNTKKKLAWLFYVNGEMARKGAAEIKLAPGDVEWWDYHPWTKNCPVPAEAR